MGALKQLYLDNGGDEYEVDAQETRSQYVRATNLAEAVESDLRDSLRDKREGVYKRKGHIIRKEQRASNLNPVYTLWKRYKWLGFIPRKSFVGCSNVLNGICWLVAYDEVYNQ